MEHLLLKAATTATDQGTFTAVISTASVDRDKDIIEPTAIAGSLAKWAKLGKLVPLAWHHTDEVVGHIDPASVRIENGEVIAKGQIDRSTPRGEESWRLVKSGTLSFSFGFLFDTKTGGSKLPGGGYRIKELDVFEISVVPVGPANNDTRVLEWKAMSSADMAERMRAMAAEMEGDNPPDPKAMARRMRAMAEQMAGMGKAIDEVRRLTRELHEVKGRLDESEQAREDLAKKAAEPGKEPKARPDDPLRDNALKAALGVLSEGATPPKVVTKEQPPGPAIEPDELKRRSRDLIVQLLSD